jgi:hypothetical protein
VKRNKKSNWGTDPVRVDILVEKTNKKLVIYPCFAFSPYYDKTSRKRFVSSFKIKGGIQI